MKFSISQSQLLDALMVVQKGLSQKASLPVLAGIYIASDKGHIEFQTTNLEMSVQYHAAALIEEEGSVVLPGKLLIDIVKNLPDAAVFIESNQEGAVISCESSSFSIHVLDPSDFPGFPQVQPEQQIKVPFEIFSRMAKKVCRVVSKSEDRMILTGVLIEVENKTLRLVATDSYRLALTEHELENTNESIESFSAVLPGNFVADLASLVKTGEEIAIAAAENQVIVSYGETIFVNRRIEGNYPNYKQLLPEKFETRCVIDRASLLAAVKRASSLGSSSAKVRLNISAHTQTIQLTSSQDTGSTQELIKAAIEGSSLEIGFDSYNTTEGLSAINTQEIAFEFLGSMKPGIIKSLEEDENYLYLVMPVRI